ncbi:MAG: BamA/TamA family outer membrane protein [Gemmatimonadetes bacterium]|nr:BamA/TamA family outer membrane protein [Gemmatimonadota bacterium]
MHIRRRPTSVDVASVTPGAGAAPRRARRLPGFVLVAAALLVGGQPAPAWAQGVREEIAAVDFVGNEAFTDVELRRAVFTQASRCPFVLAVTTCLLGIDWGRDRSYYSPRVLDDDVERLRILYHAHGFRAVQFEPEVVENDNGSVSVTFDIDEGIPFRVGEVNLIGDTLPPGLEFDGSLPIVVGDPLSGLLIEETADSLTRQLRNLGYASADVFPGFFRPGSSDWATVSYRVELGPLTTFGSIEVAGNELLDASVILDRLPFREGQLFRERQIREGQRSLHELDIVTRALVRPDTTRIVSDSVLPIRVEVVEGDARRVRTEGGLDSAECLNVEGRWASRNFFGGGRILQAQARISNLLASVLQSTPLCAQAGTGDFGQVNWRVGADLNQPTFFSPRTNLLVGLFAERQSRKNIFVRDAYGLDIGMSHALGVNSFANVRLRPELNRLAAAEVILCATFLACAPEDIEVLSAANWLSPVAVSFNRDETDELFNPTRGFRGVVDLEFADEFTGSDYSYFRAFADGSIYRAIDSRTVLALRLRAGRINPGGFEGLVSPGQQLPEVVPPQKRFYGGGANSIRGFAQSTLGPRSLSIGVEELLRRPGAGRGPTCLPAAVRDLTCDGSPLAASDVFQVRPIGGLATVEANAELRFSLGDGPWSGAAFVDMGQVWPHGLTLEDLEVAPGVGLRYNALFGPIRLDVAYSFRDRQPLQVVTSQIRPFFPGVDDPTDRIDIGPPNTPGEFIDWVVSEDLALLGPQVLFGDDPGFSIRRFQLHFSIGQAF